MGLKLVEVSMGAATDDGDYPAATRVFKNMPREWPQRYVPVSAISSRLSMSAELLSEAMKRCRVLGKHTMTYRER